ncbi:MAG TPA: hypothetical protein VK483_15595 [Chitinophagaceae bacterium]|nr:hypothetical protein [Chitinophagaceae bacterium]
MKYKWDHQAVNNQEDEDGFSLHPGNGFNYESEREKQDIISEENAMGAEFDSLKFTVAFIGAREKISQRIISPSAKQAAR